MSKWIHAKDKSPEAYCPVLICTEIGTIAIGSITPEGKWIDDHQTLDGINTVAWWRELPPLPKHM